MTGFVSPYVRRAAERAKTSKAPSVKCGCVERNAEACAQEQIVNGMVAELRDDEDKIARCACSCHDAPHGQIT